MANLPSIVQLFGIVKKDAEGMAAANANPPDPGRKIEAVYAARAPHRTVMDGEHNGVALSERHDRRTRLHARTLFSQDEFTAFEILPGLR